MTPIGEGKYSTLIRSDYLGNIVAILGNMPTAERKAAGDATVIQALKDYLDLPEKEQVGLRGLERIEQEKMSEGPSPDRDFWVQLFFIHVPLEIARKFESDNAPESKTHIYKFNAALRHFASVQNWNCVNCNMTMTGKPPWQEGSYIINTIPGHSIEFKMDISTKENGLRAKLCLPCFRSFLKTGCQAILNETEEE